MNGFEKTVKACAIGLAVVIILSIFSGITFGFTMLAHLIGIEEKEVETIQYQEEFQGINTLKIELVTANLSIEEGEKFQIEATEEKDRLTIKEQNGILKIEEKKKWGWNNSLGTIKITISKEDFLKELEIDTGAGRVDLNSVHVNELDIEEGAGTISIKNSEFQKAKISGGAGKTEIHNSLLNDLNLETGAGEAVITSKITGKSKIECGVGRVEVNILGIKEDYQLLLEKGIGSILVNKEKVSNDTTIGNGKNKLKIEGGIGSIEVNFKE